MPYDNAKLIASLSWALSELKKIYENYFEKVEVPSEEVGEEES
jgi:hypothetical protein